MDNIGKSHNAEQHPEARNSKKTVMDTKTSLNLLQALSAPLLVLGVVFAGYFANQAFKSAGFEIVLYSAGSLFSLVVIYYALKSAFGKPSSSLDK